MHPLHLLPLGLALAALSACASEPVLDASPIAAAAQPRFDPIAFFTGRSEGHAKLSKVFSREVSVRVESLGTLDKDGVLDLVQTIHEGAKPARTRQWTIREDRPGHYTGTLTDAAGGPNGGPFAAETIGNRLHLTFTMKNGFPVEQWLALSPDGRRAYNVLKVRKFGVTIAVLSEDILRVE